MGAPSAEAAAALAAILEAAAEEARLSVLEAAAAAAEEEGRLVAGAREDAAAGPRVRGRDATDVSALVDAAAAGARRGVRRALQGSLTPATRVFLSDQLSLEVVAGSGARAGVRAAAVHLAALLVAEHHKFVEIIADAAATGAQAGLLTYVPSSAASDSYANRSLDITQKMAAYSTLLRPLLEGALCSLPIHYLLASGVVRTVALSGTALGALLAGSLHTSSPWAYRYCRFATAVSFGILWMLMAGAFATMHTDNRIKGLCWGAGAVLTGLMVGLGIHQGL